MKIKWKTIWFTILYFAIIVLVFLILTKTGFYKGSNADLPIQSIPDATVKCTYPEFNMSITWDYYYINESDSLEAYQFAVDYNCTFKHQRYKINKSGGLN